MGKDIAAANDSLNVSQRLAGCNVDVMFELQRTQSFVNIKQETMPNDDTPDISQQHRYRGSCIIHLHASQYRAMRVRPASSKIEQISQRVGKMTSVKEVMPHLAGYWAAGKEVQVWHVEVD